jgi:DNA-binding transcriptional regulator YhcF (GntR family)
MRMAINRQSSLSIKEQIKGQIRMLIESGDFLPDEALPSVRDLAEILGVNRNTASAAYRELAEEGWIRILSGSGTFVKKQAGGLNRAGLKDIFIDAMKKATEQGYTQRQITDFFVTQLVSPPQPGKCRVLVVECNQETLEDIEGAIRDNFNVHTQGVLIQALEKRSETASLYLKDKDVVVCGFNHITEFQHIFPDCTLDVIPVLFKPYVRLINELLKLPPDTKVAFSCVNQRSTETFDKNLQFSKGRSLKKVYVGLDRLQELPEILDDCEVVFATSYVYDQIKDMLGDTKRLVKVDISIDPQSIELIREKINSLR